MQTVYRLDSIVQRGLLQLRGNFRPCSRYRWLAVSLLQSWGGLILSRTARHQHCAESHKITHCQKLLHQHHTVPGSLHNHAVLMTAVACLSGPATLCTSIARWRGAETARSPARVGIWRGHGQSVAASGVSMPTGSDRGSQEDVTYTTFTRVSICCVADAAHHIQVL